MEKPLQKLPITLVALGLIQFTSSPATPSFATPASITQRALNESNQDSIAVTADLFDKAPILIQQASPLRQGAPGLRRALEAAHFCGAKNVFTKDIQALSNS